MGRRGTSGLSPSAVTSVSFCSSSSPATGNGGGEYSGEDHGFLARSFGRSSPGEPLTRCSSRMPLLPLRLGVSGAKRGRNRAGVRSSAKPRS